MATGRGRGQKMPVRRGHVAPQNTYLDTIIRKFEGQSECVRRVGGRSGVLFPWQEQSDPFANFEWSRVGDTGC